MSSLNKKKILMRYIFLSLVSYYKPSHEDISCQRVNTPVLKHTINDSVVSCKWTVYKNINYSKVVLPCTSIDVFCCSCPIFLDFTDFDAFIFIFELAYKLFCANHNIKSPSENIDAGEPIDKSGISYDFYFAEVIMIHLWFFIFIIFNDIQPSNLLIYWKFASFVLKYLSKYIQGLVSNA